MNYSSDRQFRIWNYSVSHSTLFLRSYVFEESKDGKQITNDTIDIEFWAVSYIDLPDTMDGLKIKLMSSDYPDRLKDKIKFDLKVFELTNNQGTSYVIAGGCIVGKSSWDHDKGRFENLTLNYPEILATL